MPMGAWSVKTSGREELSPNEDAAPPGKRGEQDALRVRAHQGQAENAHRAVANVHGYGDVAHRLAGSPKTKIGQLQRRPSGNEDGARGAESRPRAWAIASRMPLLRHLHFASTSLSASNSTPDQSNERGRRCVLTDTANVVDNSRHRRASSPPRPRRPSRRSGKASLMTTPPKR